jgi:hypothetical protein
MGTIKGLYRKVQALQTDQVIENVFVQNEKVLTDENKKQLFAGFDNNGNRLKKYKSSVYALRKASLNPLPGFGNPDYFLTGAFYRGWEKRIDGNVIRDVLNDPKSQILLDKNPDILGLGGVYRTEAVNILRPAVIKGIRQKIGL